MADYKELIARAAALKVQLFELRQRTDQGIIPDNNPLVAQLCEEARESRKTPEESRAWLEEIQRAGKHH